MSQFRLARISLILAALGLNAVPALLSSAHAQAKPAAPAAEASKETIRAEMFKLLDPVKVKEMMTNKKFAEVQANITAAEAFPNRTPYENYIIDRMKLAMAASTGDEKMLRTALEAVIESGRLDPTEKSDFIQVLGSNYYNAKDYAKAVHWFTRYQKESATPLKVRDHLIRAYYFNKDYATAKTALLAVVAETENAGKIPPLEDLQLLASSASQLKDPATYGAVMEKLVAHYPTDDYWTDLLKRMLNKPGFSERLLLDTYRLQFMAVTAMAPEEYVEMTEAALIAGMFTEAKKTVDAGYAAGVLGTGGNAAKHKQLRDKATKGAADDVKTIASGEAGAAKAKTGLPMVNLGYAYVTMDQFDKGIDLMEKGIAKGGLKRADDANLHLGVAYAKAGRKADALKVFDSLKGDDGMGDLARYWTMYLNRPAAAPAAPAAAPIAAPAAATK